MMIRREQLDLFARRARKSFEDRLFSHLHRRWPKRCARLGPDAVRQSIRRGAARARRYGFVSEIEVASYVDLMYALSLGFDRSPETAWAAEILNDLESPALFRIQRLRSAVRNGHAGPLFGEVA